MTILLVTIGPVLIAIHPAIPFLNDGNCDPWFLFGTFYHFPDAAHWHGNHGPGRQIARLTQVIPGYLLTKAFDGVGADYAMFFMYYSAAVLFFHRAVRILIDDNVALFAAILFAVHPLIVANYSVTFASPAITYSIASLYFVARALVAVSSRGKLAWLFVSGIAIGAALHAYLGIVAFGIANYLIFLFRVLFYAPATVWQRIWGLVRAGLVVSAGMAGFTVALGSVAVLFGADFSLVFTQFLYIPAAHTNGAEYYFKPDWYLYGGVAGTLVAACLTSGINIYSCSARTKRFALREDVRKRLLSTSWAILFLTILLLAYNEFGGVFLQYDYYYVFFVPYFCLIIFSPLLFFDFGKTRYVVLWAAIFLICCLGAITFNDDVLGWLHQSPIESVALFVVAVCAGLTYGYFVFARRIDAGAAAFYAALVILVLVIVRPEQMGAQIWTSPRDLKDARAYQRVRDGLAVLNRIQFKEFPLFWIDQEGAPPELIVYPRSYLSCGFEDSFPGIDDERWNRGRRFKTGDDVVIVSKAPNLRHIASVAFSALGLLTDEVADFTLPVGEEHYEFLTEHVSGQTAAAASFQWLIAGKVPPDAEEIKNAFGSPLVPGSNLKLQDKLPVDITTSSEPGAYAAQFPLRLVNLRGPLWIRIRANIHTGPIGIGILNQDGSAFLTRTTVNDSGDTTVTLHVSKPEEIGDLVFMTADSADPASVRVDAIKVLLPPQSTLEAVFGKTHRMKTLAQARSLSADMMTLGAAGASLQPGASGVAFRSLNKPWAYVGRMRLNSACIKGGGWIAVDVLVTHGTIGVGVLKRNGVEFLVQRPVARGDTMQTIFLRIDSFAAAGDLILRNWDTESSSEGLFQAVRIVAEDEQPPTVCDPDNHP